MIDTTTQEFVSILEKAGVVGEPCDEWQVQDAEQQLRVKLPPAYKAFLLIAGQGFGPFEGSHYAFEDDLAELQRVGRRILQRDQAELPPDAFVFFVHQGFVVRFFLLDEDDDPAVNEYVEYERPGKPVKQLARRFTDFLLHEIRATKS
jgi:hypothetical protein